MEMRSEDLEWVSELRSAREKAVSLSSQGKLSAVFDTSAGDPAQEVYVVKLLDVHPRLGKVAGRTLLDDHGLSHFTRVRELADDEQRLILVACGEQS